MASWVLVPCLISLRDEFNRLAPNRDHASDGSIGNQVHADSSSDHNPDETGNTPYEDADNRNEVHAIDTDDDLRKPGWDMTRCVQIIVERHRTGKDDRLQNVIWNRRIWSRSWGWTAKAYTGASAHTEHAHFSARYTTAQENDTRPWGLLAADRKVTMVDITGKLPELEYGDTDDTVPGGTVWIRRAQAELDLLAGPCLTDGDYGDATAAAVKRLMKDDPKRSTTTGRKIGLPEWRRLYGIW